MGVITIDKYIRKCAVHLKKQIRLNDIFCDNIDDMFIQVMKSEDGTLQAWGYIESDEMSPIPVMDERYYRRDDIEEELITSLIAVLYGMKKKGE